MKVHEIIRKKAIEGDVGIEVETEGARLWAPLARDPFWKGEADGSLRGEALEYVYKKPQPIGKVRESMEHLNAKFIESGSKLDYSFRTSVHVHVNVGTMEYDALLAFMYAYLVLERAITKYCGDERLGNRFCLRYEDAEGLSEAFNSMIVNGPEGLKQIPQDRYRYAAMNIDAVKKYGSLEFRSMRGTNDVDIVSNWAQALINLRDYAEALGNPKEVFEAVNHFGPVGFAQQALGNMFQVFDNPDLMSDIRYSFSITLDFPFNWADAKEAPKPKENNLQDLWVNLGFGGNNWIAQAVPAAQEFNDFEEEEEDHDED